MMDFESMFPEVMMPSNTPKAAPEPMSLLQPHPKKNHHQQEQQQQQQPPPKYKATKRATSTTKPKKTKVAPLPACVEARGYEITIPNTKTCWRVSVIHACTHPVLEVSEVHYPGCDSPLVIEINRHMRSCTDKCKLEGLDHVVSGLCQTCLQRQQEEEELRSQDGFFGDGNAGGVHWDGMPRFDF